jgi:hypothetical protein
VDPDSAFLLVFHVLYLLAEGIEPADTVDADETAFLLCCHIFRTWARSGSKPCRFMSLETRSSRAL